MSSLIDALWAGLTQLGEYLSAHVVTCLIPAFFIAFKKESKKMQAFALGEPMTIEKVILNASKIDCTGCRTCADLGADNLRHAICRLSGVSKAKVDGITGKVTIEYDTQKINLSKITERIEKLGYQVEILSRE